MLRLLNKINPIFWGVAVAANFELPPGDPWKLSDISRLLHLLANWLIAIGVVGAVISFVAAGIMYFTSGFSTKSADKGKELFRNALIGTLIILAVGVIINTVSYLVTGEFFDY